MFIFILIKDNLIFLIFLIHFQRIVEVDVVSNFFRRQPLALEDIPLHAHSFPQHFACFGLLLLDPQSLDEMVVFIGMVGHTRYKINSPDQQTIYPPIHYSITSLLFILMLQWIIVAVVMVQTQCYDWSSADSIVYNYFLEGAYPGAVLKIANATHTLHQYTVGYLTKQIPPYSTPPMTLDTIFDIASLTKVTATLTCIMHLYELEVIDIDDKVVQYIPEYGNHGKENTIIKNLLLHNSGLLEDPPEGKYNNRDQIMKYIYNCELDYPIGSMYNYSDLGFILLAEIAERVIGGPLDDYSKLLLDKIGLKNTTFLPNLTETLYRIAPTQYSPQRRKVMRGEVDDITAYKMGGVAGDAGLFSTATDLETYMQFHLRKGITKNNTRIFQQSTISRFYTRIDGLPYSNRRALGWDTVPIQQYPPCGNLFSLNSFGHTGYTGTMMWADRDRQLIIVFLTNRIYPSDIDITIRKVRSLLSDAIVLEYDRYRSK